MIGYYGFENPAVASYLGIPVEDLQRLQQVLPEYQGIVQQQGIPQEEISKDYALMQRYAGESGGGPMGGANRLENILKGLAYLAGHPEGSKHHGFNPTNLLANFATGGLYGVGKGLTSGDPMQAGAAGAAPLSPGGIAPINTELRGPQSTLIGAGATLATAGLAGAFGSGGGMFVPENAVSGIDPATGNPAYMIKSSEGISYIPMDQATPGAFYTGPVTGAMAGAGNMNGPATGNIGPSGTASGGGLGETALGLSAVQQLAGMLTPQGGGGAMPAQPAGMAPTPGAKAPSGALLAAQGADSPTYGLDPTWQPYAKGKSKRGKGIADDSALSQQDAQAVALAGFSGYPPYS